MTGGKRDCEQNYFEQKIWGITERLSTTSCEKLSYGKTKVLNWRSSDLIWVFPNFEQFESDPWNVIKSRSVSHVIKCDLPLSGVSKQYLSFQIMKKISEKVKKNCKAYSLSLITSRLSHLQVFPSPLSSYDVFWKQ